MKFNIFRPLSNPRYKNYSAAAFIMAVIKEISIPFPIPTFGKTTQ